MKLSQLREFGLIERLAKIIGKPSSRVVIGIGDDAAVLEIRNTKSFGPSLRTRSEILNNHKLPNSKYQLITTDTLVENVHFIISKRFSFAALGRKAMLANISDIAAMGGVPTFAVVTIGAPSGFSVERIVELYKGMKEEGKKHKVSIVGGDTVRSPRELIISITLLGEVEKQYLLTRAGAKVGDLICVTGKFGGPAVSRFEIGKQTAESRTQEARIVAKSRLATAMIDSSDGLVRSILELCKASKVGARLWEDKVPIAKGATLQQALYGGEEYELVFLVPPSKVKKLKKLKFSIVGEIVSRQDNSLPSAGGYEHFKVLK